MKVAIFSDTYLPQVNGVALTVKRQVEYFSNNNIEYRIFAPKWGNYIDDENVRRIGSLKFILYPECRLSMPNYRYVSRELNEFQPDLIHVMSPIIVGYLGVKYAGEYGVPLVSTFHTNFSQYLEYYNMKFLENISWKYFKWFHNRCDRNFCPSMETLKELKTKGVRNVEVCHNGIDLKEFSPKYRDIEFRKQNGFDNKIVFLYVGRMAAEKDINIFLETAVNINKKYRDKVHFLMVGDGPMKKDLEEAGLPNMTFTGYLKGKELARAYASSDVFMFPSCTETCGNVILEAMASKIPAIVCRSGGVLENVKNGYNGFVCNVKDPEDMFKASERIILNSDERKRLSENAYKHAQTMTWETVFGELVEGYEDVLKMKLQSYIA